MITKPTLQKILQGIMHNRRWRKTKPQRIGSIKPQEKKRQVIRECSDLYAHNQILKKQEKP
jgi:hypothetical protein